MKLHELKNTFNRQAHKRVGRGDGSGNGRTAGRGDKGAGARAGAKRRPHFEGGQIPLIRRLPKRGFYNPFRINYVAINVDRLEVFEDGMTVTPVELIEYGIIKKIDDGIKIMGNGELTKKLTVQAAKFAATAKEKIEAAGGKAEVI